VLKNMSIFMITSLFYFIIGLYVAKKGILNNFSLHRKFARRVWLYSLLASIPLSVGITLLHLELLDNGVLTEQLIQSFLLISGLTIGIFYKIGRASCRERGLIAYVVG